MQDAIIPRLGWKKDRPDTRDYRFAAAPPQEIALPIRVDVRHQLGAIDDQGEAGTCTGFATEAAFRALRHNRTVYSRLFLYYLTRELEGTANYDAGGELRDAVKALVNTGICPESAWKYNLRNLLKRPSKTAYKKAAPNQVVRYERIDNGNLSALKQALATGFPVVFGFWVYSSFAETLAPPFIVPLPRLGGDPLWGGHAAVLVGYDDATQLFAVRNSWGKDFGDAGHFYLPYGYIENTQLADDFWVIREAE